jgi:hypothetical protein
MLELQVFKYYRAVPRFSLGYNPPYLFMYPSLFLLFAPGGIEHPFPVMENQRLSICDLDLCVRNAIAVQIHPNGAHGSVICFGLVLEERDVDIPVTVFLVDEPNG